MVLVPELTVDEMDRHKALIEHYFEDVRQSKDVEIIYHGNGVEKGVYKVRSGNDEFIAAAAARDQGRLLLKEYNILHHLYNHAPEYFPKPIAHYSDPSPINLGDLLLMELLPHLDLMKFDKYSVNYGNGFGRELAYQIGVAMGEINS